MIAAPPGIERWRAVLAHGIELSCRGCGAPGRPTIVFLHGFPQAAFVWDELMLRLADAGWRCVAPNLRGYETSSKPEAVEAYRPRHLVQDVAALIESLGAPIDALVAHDWGGALAWSLANQHPELIRKLVILNAPHPGPFIRELRDNPAQQAASTYMIELTLPDAEERLAANDFAALWQLFEGMGHAREPARWLDAAMRERHRQAWQAGLRGPCNFYRASPLRPPRPGDPGAAALQLPDTMLRVERPTLVLWGDRDEALLPGVAQGLDRWVPDLKVRHFPQASHWLLHEEPERVFDEIRAFVAH